MRYETKITDDALFGLDRPARTRACDCPGCGGVGEYRAPKGRDQLTAYYWFCLDHVRDYNLQWDYFAGMGQAEIETHIKQDSCWQRETWPMGSWKRRETELRQKLEEEFPGGPTGGATPEDLDIHMRRHHIPVAVVEALAVLELKPPADFLRIKAQYKALVKRHHPDANGGSREAEDRLKGINQAFTTLRKIYDGDNAG